MIKKYLVKPTSVFNKSLMFSFFEQGKYGFKFDGLTDNDIRDLFPKNKIKFIKDEIDIKSVPTKCVVAYFEDDLSLKALVLRSNSNKYYLFKVDHQKDLQLNIHQKYISDNLDNLLDDFEKHCKTKGKSTYAGVGDPSLIENIDFFEDKYESETQKQVDKSSTVYRLLFTSNNYFTVDFIDLVNHGEIAIVNKNRIDPKSLTLESMQKHKTNRKDCLLIDSETKDIKYFIFTYRPHLINHYYLLKNLGNNRFEFIGESISFNKILISNELKDIKYKKGSAFAAKEFAKMRYDNFYLEYVAFEEEEEFDEEVKNELSEIEIALIKKEALLEAVMSSINNCKLNADIAISYHGKVRITERIGEMSDEQMFALAKVAYEFGKTSGHYIEKDPLMFKFLQYQQNKKLGKTLRLYNDILFFYSMEPPHELVTCFPYKTNYDTYVENVNKREKKKR